MLVRAAAGLAVVGELIGDKLPSTPSRLQLWQGRVAAGGVGAALLARRAQAPLLLPVAAGLAGAAAGTWGGAAWRAWADQRLPGAAAAILEDGLALTLAWWSVSVR